eukprot:202474-Pyramimonas_sp.AAC.1
MGLAMCAVVREARKWLRSTKDQMRLVVVDVTPSTGTLPQLAPNLQQMFWDSEVPICHWNTLGV